MTRKVSAAQSPAATIQRKISPKPFPIPVVNVNKTSKHPKRGHVHAICQGSQRDDHAGALLALKTDRWAKPYQVCRRANVASLGNNSPSLWSHEARNLD